MIELSKIKYCPDLDEGGEVKDSDKKVILKKYILDVKYKKINKKDKFIIFFDNYEYSTNKIYLWQKIITNYVLKRGYNTVIFKINYVNLDLEIEKKFSSPLLYPEERLMAGEYCKRCIYRKDCPELEETFLGDFYFKTEDMNDAQLFNIFTLINTRKRAIEASEKQVKEILYDKIEKNGGELVLPEIGVKLSRKKIEKDSITFLEAQALGVADNDTVNMKISAIKSKLKKDKILASKIKFKKVPFRTELVLENIDKNKNK